MKLLSDIGNTLENAHDSRGGKFAVVASVLIALIGVVGNHLQAVDARKDREQLLEQARRHERFLDHQYGSNYVNAVETRGKK